MKKLGILIIALFSLTTNGLGQLEADYSDCLSELQGLLAEWEALETGENISEETKEAIGAQVRDLVESLELGEAAEEHGVDDETIQNGAAQLLSSSIAMSFNVLLRGSETLDLAHRLEDAARRLFGKAETAILLAEALRSHPGFDYYDKIKGEQHCSVNIWKRIENPDSSPRFARYNVTATGFPSNGVFTWAVIRWKGKGLVPTVEGSTLFETFEGQMFVLRDAGLNGEVLPVQSVEHGNQMVYSERQIVKNVSLRGGVLPLKPFEMLGWTFAVSYLTPKGVRCWDHLTWDVYRETGPTKTSRIGRSILDFDALIAELDNLEFPFGK